AQHGSRATIFRIFSQLLSAEMSSISAAEIADAVCVEVRVVDELCVEAADLRIFEPDHCIVAAASEHHAFAVERPARGLRRSGDAMEEARAAPPSPQPSLRCWLCGPGSRPHTSPSN